MCLTYCLHAQEPLQCTINPTEAESYGSKSVQHPACPSALWSKGVQTSVQQRLWLSARWYLCLYLPPQKHSWECSNTPAAAKRDDVYDHCCLRSWTRNNCICSAFTCQGKSPASYFPDNLCVSMSVCLYVLCTKTPTPQQCISLF